MSEQSVPLIESEYIVPLGATMDTNVGGFDRYGRIAIGLILAIVGIAAIAGYVDVDAIIGGVALVVGAVLLVTGATQKCPINSIIGIDTTN